MSQNQDYIHYQKKIGAFRPHFEGKSQGYYTLTNFDVCCGVFSCIGIIFLTFGICIGLYFWSHNVSTNSVVTVWSIILIVFIPLFMVTAFCFSKGKAEVEEQLIRKALDKQIRKKSNKEFQLTKMKLRDSLGIYENNLTQQAILQK